MSMKQKNCAWGVEREVNSGFERDPQRVGMWLSFSFVDPAPLLGFRDQWKQLLQRSRTAFCDDEFG